MSLAAKALRWEEDLVGWTLRKEGQQGAYSGSRGAGEGTLPRPIRKPELKGVSLGFWRCVSGMAGKGPGMEGRSLSGQEGSGPDWRESSQDPWIGSGSWGCPPGAGACFGSSKARAAVGVPLLELGVRGCPGSSGGRLRHVLARFLGQLWLGGASSGTRATGPRLLCGGWPSAGHGTRLAGLAGRASRAWWFLGWALALLTTRWSP